MIDLCCFLNAAQLFNWGFARCIFLVFFIWGLAAPPKGAAKHKGHELSQTLMVQARRKKRGQWFRITPEVVKQFWPTF